MKGNFLERFSSAADLGDEPFPGIPLIEIAGYRRVIVEHHMGVTAYSGDMVCLKVKYGYVHIEGEDLIIRKMSKEQLVICGTIFAVSIGKERNI